MEFYISFKRYIKTISVISAFALMLSSLTGLSAFADDFDGEIGDNFVYSVTEEGILIEEYIGQSDSIAIKATYDVNGVSLPVKAIGNFAFEAAQIKSVKLENGISEIYEGAFYECDYLTEVVIPESVSVIGDFAFDDCNSLTKVTVLNNSAEIGESAFGYYAINIGTNRNPVYEYHIVDNLIMIGYSNSTAYQYATGNGINFESIASNRLGDINQDNFVDSRDIVRLKKIVAMIFSDDSAYTDVNGDGIKANATDVTVLRMYLLNIMESIPKYTVTFEDINGATIKSESVYRGFSTIAPALDEIEGYKFLGWDKDYSSVCSDLEIKPVYEQITFAVNFCDYDGTVLNTQNVPYGQDAIPPVAPQREGYLFIDWDCDFTNVKSDLTVIARYKKLAEKHMVTFVDYDGRTISQVEVSHGSAAVLPDEPMRTGYVFAGWNGTYYNVTSDCTVIAEYIENTNDNIFKVNSVNSEYGETVTVAIELTGTVKMNGYELVLNYDTNKLKLNNAVNGAGVEYNHIENQGKIKISYLNKQCIDEYNPRIIITLSFQVLTQESEATILDLECESVFDAAELFMFYSVIDGAVVIN